MSYSVRNSIILTLILIVFAGGGYLWLYLKFESNIGSLTNQVTNKEKTLAELESATADYEYFKDELNKTTIQLEYFPKLLAQESAIQGTYRYLDKLSTRRASFKYDFRFVGVKPEAGALKASYVLTGEGKFSNIANFIYRLENGKPIYKIESLTVKRKTTRGREIEDLVEVNMQLTGLFSDGNGQSDSEVSRMFEKALIIPGMRLKILQESEHTEMQYHTIQAGETLKKIAEDQLGNAASWREIYDLNRPLIKNPHLIYRGQSLKIMEKIIDDYYVYHEVKPGETLRSLADQYLGDEDNWREINKWNQDKIQNQIPDDILTNYDPFKPLVLTKLPPNLADLLNVAQAKLVALTNRSAFIQDQKGIMRSLQVGDKVYLGYLMKIDLNRGKVTFNMNKGGIYSTTTLNLVNAGKD
ncbi:MAG: LysM peptidoglycan-binding domain-containing protein [Candidatus Marinimicrobia bacterium]|nr:LysM peptidoglycan-binding domain-containing protein [Candidatus Neomarinimicrobiota bacterium]